LRLVLFHFICHRPVLCILSAALCLPLPVLFFGFCRPLFHPPSSPQIHHLVDSYTDHITLAWLLWKNLWIQFLNPIFENNDARAARKTIFPFPFPAYTYPKVNTLQKHNPVLTAFDNSLNTCKLFSLQKSKHPPIPQWSNRKDWTGMRRTEHNFGLLTQRFF